METLFKFKVSIVPLNAFIMQWLSFWEKYFVNFSAKLAVMPLERQNFELKGFRPSHTISPSFFA